MTLIRDLLNFIVQYKEIIKAIIANENNKTFDQLNQKQKIFSQILDKNNWDIIE